MRQFIHEAFQVDRILVDVDAAPETRRDVGLRIECSTRRLGSEYPIAASPVALRPAKVAGSLPLTSASGRRLNRMKSRENYLVKALDDTANPAQDRSAA
jgi:hypothetical protein